MKSPSDIDRKWFAGDGSGRDASGRPKNKEKAVVVNDPLYRSDGTMVKKRPCAQEGKKKNSVEKDKDEKNKDANKDKKETKDGKESNAEKDKDEKKSGKKVCLPLPSEAAKNGEGKAKGKNKKEKQEDLKQAKKTKGDPQPVKDTTQENINRFFGLAVAALLTASA